jgi:circadian clock protein KaiC
MTSWHATTFLIGEYAQAESEANPIMTVADGVLALAQAQEQNSVVRKIRIIKMRGQAHLAGSHTFRISGQGVRIFPRLLPPLADDDQPGGPIHREQRRISTGVPDLDQLMNGGLPLGHSMLVVGPTGCGKTILGTRFLQAGVTEGEKGVAVYFEKGSSRLRNTELARMVQAGDVTVVESRSLDLTVEELLDDLLVTLDRTGATRVVIDSLSEFGLYLAPEFRDDLRHVVFRMLSALAKRGVSAIVTFGMDDRYTELRFSQADISFLTDAIVAMRYAEVEGRLAKAIAVVKVRGSAHSHDLREYRITDKGIEIDSHPTRFDGLLSGRTSPRSPPNF